MHACLRAALLSSALLLVCWMPALADDAPTISTTPRVVGVGINFSGAEVLADGTTVEGTQVVVTVSSEPTSVKLSKKGRVMGIFWMTTETAVVQNMPSFHTVYASQPLDTLLGKAEQLQIGADPECASIMSQARVIGSSGGGEPMSPEQAREYVVALRDIYIKGQKYVPCASCHTMQAHPGIAPSGVSEPSQQGVTLSDNAWQTRIRLPADAPLGKYDVTVYSVRDQKLVASRSTTFSVQKTGLEQALAAMAVNNPSAYGAMSLALVILAGLCIGFVFPKGGH